MKEIEREGVKYNEKANNIIDVYETTAPDFPFSVHFF